MYPLDDTIAAIASPPGGAARGMVRISGPRTLEVVRRFFQPDDRTELSPPASWETGRPSAMAGSLRLPQMASPLPCELYLWPAGRSYTKAAVAELHTLGSPPLLQSVLNALCAAGARLAEPGEFTLRAFLAGRIDLTQAEAVLGVIDAVDPDELDVALSQLAGGLAGPLHALRDGLLDLLAHLEAGFDFADEDLPFITADQLRRQLAEALGHVARLARQMDCREETAGAIRAVLVGWPNTGKSSLFNALAGDADALVCQRPGTTRDYLTADLDLDGVKCQLIDTAGLQIQSDGSAAVADVSGSVQQAAQMVSLQQSRRAHVRIFCLDSTRGPNDWERNELVRTDDHRRIVVLTKIDARRETGHTEDGLPTSSMTGEGIDALREALRGAVLTAGASGGLCQQYGVVAGTAARCRQSLRLAAESLKRAQEIVCAGGGEELVAAEIRVALQELGKVVGAVYTDDLLDRIFSRFCIGK